MRDYTKIPGNEGLTELDAKYRYLHDLLRKYQGIPEQCTCWDDYKCKRRETVARCQECPLWVALDHIGARAACCNWAAESKPDMAIWVLEQLLKEEDMKNTHTYREPERPTEPPEEPTYYCPVCGEENPARYFRNNLMEIVGCNHCIEELDAAQWEADHAD